MHQNSLTSLLCFISKEKTKEILAEHAAGPPRSIRARAVLPKTSIALMMCNILRKSAACALGRLAKRRWNQQCQAHEKA